jgi:hypothetical protein
LRYNVRRHLPLDVGRPAGTQMRYQTGFGGARFRITGKEDQTLAMGHTTDSILNDSDDNQCPFGAASRLSIVMTTPAA